MDTALRPGDMLLQKYRVERVLGQGGMGIVVAARHVELGQVFAIKCMLPSALSEEGAIERFLREARAAAQIRSEHVVRVVDVGRLETGAPYMVMEHLSGSDLGAIVGARGALPVGEAVTYVLEACEALSEAHAMGIVHRDLKPANLFVVRRPNGTSFVKVLDFGIAKQTVPGQVALTKTNAVMGSPLYMSPEQMFSSKNVDLRADVWAMGVVLYELCTGQVPFEGATVTEVVARVVQQEPAPPSTIRPNIPAGIDAAIARCLHKQPEQRYATIAELAAAIRPFAGAPIGMSRDDIAHADTVSAIQASASPLLRAPSASRRRAGWIVGGVAATGLVLGIAAASLWSSHRSMTPLEPPLLSAPATTEEPATAEPPSGPSGAPPAAASEAPPSVTPAPVVSGAATAPLAGTAPADARSAAPALKAAKSGAAKAAPTASAPASTKREPLF